MKHQTGIRIAGGYINNLRYVDDTTLMTEGEEGLMCILMKEKEESEKAGLKLNIQKTKITALGPITYRRGNSGNRWQIDRWGNNGNSDRLYIVGLQNHWRS